jgi:hypothetical protein
MNDFEKLKGKTIVSVTGLEPNSSKVIFYCSDGTMLTMHHMQDCCEQVWLEDIIGTPENITGVCHYAHEDIARNPIAGESGTWTFYNVQTDKGFVTLRWNGESNGYYSESVDLEWSEAKV